jgi:hypothetical protein
MGAFMAPSNHGDMIKRTKGSENLFYMTIERDNSSFLRIFKGPWIRSWNIHGMIVSDTLRQIWQLIARA